MTYGTINDAQTVTGDGEGTILAGRYRIVRQLGQGGMGSVWLAEDIQLDNKPFAIKMLPSILVSNKRAYRQLKDEALVAMRLVHPNIVQIRAFEENNGNPFLVMDYIDGQTLDDYLAEHGGGDLTQSRREAESQSGRAGASQDDPVGRDDPIAPYGEEGDEGRGTRPACPSGGIPEEDVLRILKPIAAALDYAHGEGVVHRDVKPANVMIRKDGHPFILDFGIAREIQETMTRVTGKLSSGTLLYMSPEQLMGESPKAAQDVYSFAAMVYECLKGEPPFSHGQIEFQIMNKQPEPLVGRGVLAEPLVAGIMSGLAKKPEDRPASCSAVLEGNLSTQRREDAEAQGGRARTPAAPHDDGGARRPAEPVGTRVPRDRTGGPRPVAAKGILLVALLAALAGGAWWFVNMRAARSTGELRVENGELRIGGGATGTTDVSPVATEADVAEIAVEATVQKARMERLDDADGFKERKIALADGLVRATAYGKAKRWADAAQGFTNYVAGCKALLELDVARHAAKKSKADTEGAKTRASEAESSKYVESRWKAASDFLEAANGLFGKMAFADATSKYAAAAKQFDLCVDEARIERKRQEENVAATRHEQYQTPEVKRERQPEKKVVASVRSERGGHDKVQLWEDGPYWATTNIGANRPEDYGYYFWWGDTMGYKREGETWAASDGSQSGFSFSEDSTPTWGKSKDVLRNEGWITAEGVLALEHDAAHVKWGGDWRMPTKQELSDLNSNCDWNWTTMNGTQGYVVKGKGAYASASIFLPAAGYGNGASLSYAGSDGHYWSSVPGSVSYDYAWYLDFYSSNHVTDDCRYYGQSVRPVQGFTK